MTDINIQVTSKKLYELVNYLDEEFDSIITGDVEGLFVEITGNSSLGYVLEINVSWKGERKCSK